MRVRLSRNKILVGSSIILTVLASYLSYPQPKLKKTYFPLSTYIYTAKGVGLTNHDCDTLLKVKAGWYHNWSLQSSSCADSIRFVPMLWRDDIYNLTSVVLDNSAYLLMFNEPERADQANLTPAQAVELWHAVQARYPHLQLIGPNISQEGANWLLQWHDLYTRTYGRPIIYALGAHCYARPDYCQQWLTWNLNLARDWTTSRTVWLTEYAILPCWYADPQQAITDRTIISNWIRQQPAITHYAWFASELASNQGIPWDINGLCNTELFDGQYLTTTGNWYRSLP